MPYSTSVNRAAAMSTFEKSVKGGTKVKLAPPKSKYVEHILLATQSGEAGVAEVFRTLTHRLRDATWTVAFKALIIVHLMIKEGAQDATLRYLAAAPRTRLAISSFTDVQTQGRNIRVYSEYLLARAQAYERTMCDYVKAGEGRMKRLTVEKGLLRETEVVQDQINALVKCDLPNNDVENEISLMAFRLLTSDLLALYNVENEAVMNVLSHYFEMSRPDAERAITIYKKFCKQTEEAVKYLSTARQYEHATRLEIPTLKHAPTSLAASLQEYLDDKDFEINRRQYLAEQEVKKSGKPFLKASQPASQRTVATGGFTPSHEKSVANPVTAGPAVKGPAPDLIDFFESIESNQQTMQTNPFLQQQQPQPTGFHPPPQIPQIPDYQQQPPPQFSNGFTPNAVPVNPHAPQQLQALEAQYTGAGFGGYGPQPAQQQVFAPGNALGPGQQQYTGTVQAQSPNLMPRQITNPFRLSMMMTGAGGPGAFNIQVQPPQGTNPFSRTGIPLIPESGPVPAPLPQAQQTPSPLSPQLTLQASFVQPQPTGTNPFAKNAAARQSTFQTSAPGPLQVQATGSTNPFRQSMFVHQQTGSGWQNGPQGTIGGLESLPTVPVFPRPGQATGQSTHQSPWG